MDDDDLRRGRPTLHRAFDEATAVLAGDALLTLAFELLATRPAGQAAVPRRLAAVAVVARRAGLDGMVGGQMADLEAERRPVDAPTLDWIHGRKTGALFAAAAELGAIHAGADGAARAAVAAYGEAIGLAFQITDDLLDRTASPEMLGKTPGKDLQRGKATYPLLVGAEASRREAERLAAHALAALRPLDLCSPALEGLAGLVVSRSS
jgi:geranylgeranyl pyrophosphate synthase